MSHPALKPSEQCTAWCCGPQHEISLQLTYISRYILSYIWNDHCGGISYLGTGMFALRKKHCKKSHFSAYLKRLILMIIRLQYICNSIRSKKNRREHVLVHFFMSHFIEIPWPRSHQCNKVQPIERRVKKNPRQHVVINNWCQTSCSPVAVISGVDPLLLSMDTRKFGINCLKTKCCLLPVVGHIRVFLVLSLVQIIFYK